MRKLHTYVLTQSLGLLLLIFTMSCYHGDVLDQNDAVDIAIEAEEEGTQAVSQSFAYQAPIPEASLVLPPDPLLNQVPLSHVVGDYFPLGSKEPDPWRFARSVFDDNLDVEPWRANYVGSYGVLPTRFQDKGPFLYSFDISPDADIFQDDDLDPFRHLHDDDDR